MKLFFSILTVLTFLSGAFSQYYDLDEVKQRLSNTRNDSLRLIQLDSLSFSYSEINSDSSLIYAEKAINLSCKLGLGLNEAMAMSNKGYALMNLGNYSKSLQTYLSALQIAGDSLNEKKILPDKYRFVAGIHSSYISPHIYRLNVLAGLHFNLGILYENTNNPEKEFYHYNKALQIAEETGDLAFVGIVNMNLGRLYLSINKLDSALLCEQKAYEISTQLNLNVYKGSVLLNLGRVYLARGERQEAFSYIQNAIGVSRQQKYIRGVIAGNILLAEMKIQDNKIDSGYFFANAALSEAIQLNLPDLLLRTYITMSNYYKRAGNSDSIVRYQDLVINLKDSLFNSRQQRQFQNILFDEMQRQQEMETTKKEYRDKIQKYGLLAGLIIFLVIAILLWRNNRHRVKAYNMIRRQKQEIETQKTKVETTLEELRSTQSQLVHSEKMASLGELTAGIAHEIQNPLNFVNNFSAVNKELLEEANIALIKGNQEEVRTLLTTIMENEEKIKVHGDRADGIVKSMLQHSRASSGQKEPTDINALCNEYLRLAYHAWPPGRQGLQGKGKSFNIILQTDFDASIEKISVIPQDIGRLLLNLYNNAFYACAERSRSTVSEKMKRETLHPEGFSNPRGGGSYEPLVSVRTKKKGNNIEISIEDNGIGIPDAIKDKIFQPFFTTKPTGEGTGLGLSLAYDIIKAHGGEMNLESTEGKGAGFFIHLPLV